MNKTPSPRPRGRALTRPAADWLAGLVIPLAVVAVVFVLDLRADMKGASDVLRSGLLSFTAGMLQLVVILAVAPWWSAGLVEKHAFGTLIAALRVTAMVVGATILLLLLAFVQDRDGFADLLKVQLVVLGVGLFVVGLSGGLRVLLRNTRAAAMLTSLPAFLVFATPFWGNVLIRLCGEVGRGWAWQFVVKVTPILACADAVPQDLFRHGERLLYESSLIIDAAAVFPAWWAYALITGLIGVALVWGVTFSRRHVIIRS